MLTDDYCEHEENVKLGNKSVYNPNSSVVHSIKSSNVYQDAINDLEIVQKERFSDIMENFLTEVESYLKYPESSQEDVKNLLEVVRERVYNEDYE